MQHTPATTNQPIPGPGPGTLPSRTTRHLRRARQTAAAGVGLILGAVTGLALPSAVVAALDGQASLWDAMHTMLWPSIGVYGQSDPAWASTRAALTTLLLLLPAVGATVGLVWGWRAGRTRRRWRLALGSVCLALWVLACLNIAIRQGLAQAAAAPAAPLGSCTLDVLEGRVPLFAGAINALGVIPASVGAMLLVLGIWALACAAGRLEARNGGQAAREITVLTAATAGLIALAVLAQPTWALGGPGSVSCPDETTLRWVGFGEDTSTTTVPPSAP